MKKIVLILLVALVWGCTQKTKVEVSKNYVPETPELQSDKMTPEVLWSFGRLGGAQVSPDGKMVLYTVTYYTTDLSEP